MNHGGCPINSPGSPPQGAPHEQSCGAVAQLVAHLHGMQGVRGSSPLSSTGPNASPRDRLRSRPSRGVGARHDEGRLTSGQAPFADPAAGLVVFLDARPTAPRPRVRYMPHRTRRERQLPDHLLVSSPPSMFPMRTRTYGIPAKVDCTSNFETPQRPDMTPVNPIIYRAICGSRQSWTSRAESGTPDHCPRCRSTRISSRPNGSRGRCRGQ